MGVINAATGKKSIGKNPISRLIDWVESLFGHSAPAPTAPAAHGEGDSPIDPNLMEFGKDWDKTGGWDRRKHGGWSPHGDEGMK